MYKHCAGLIIHCLMTENYEHFESLISQNFNWFWVCLVPSCNFYVAKEMKFTEQYYEHRNNFRKRRITINSEVKSKIEVTKERTLINVWTGYLNFMFCPYSFDFCFCIYTTVSGKMFVFVKLYYFVQVFQLL